MMRIFLLVLLLLVPSIAFSQTDPGGDDAPAVDLELVLATDVSYSMDKEKLALRREG